MQPSLCVLSIGVLLSGLSQQFLVYSIPIQDSHSYVNRTQGDGKSLDICANLEMENLCDKCTFFLQNCDDSLSHQCELGQAACGLCRAECLRFHIQEEDEARRRKRQVDGCIGIKGACGGSGHCCVNLFCQSTSAGRGNRRKTCRP